MGARWAQEHSCTGAAGKGLELRRQALRRLSMCVQGGADLDRMCEPALPAASANAAARFQACWHARHPTRCPQEQAAELLRGGDAWSCVHPRACVRGRCAQANGIEAADTAVLLNSLASLLLDLGKFDDAEKVRRLQQTVCHLTTSVAATSSRVRNRHSGCVCACLCLSPPRTVRSTTGWP